MKNLMLTYETSIAQMYSCQILLKKNCFEAETIEYTNQQSSEKDKDKVMYFTDLSDQNKWIIGSHRNPTPWIIQT